MLQRAKVLFSSGRGWKRLALHFLAAFGLLGGAVQLYTAVLPKPPISGAVIFLTVVATALIWSGFNSFPRTHVTRGFTSPNIVVEVKSGDIFEQDSHLVIGFNDVFDTDTSDGTVISPRSLQGQFLARVYNGDASKLDDALHASLKGQKKVRTERPWSKKKGKRVRYPVGTVATIAQDQKLYFCVAYSTMGNNLVAKSTIDDLWNSLGKLWQAVYENAQRQDVSIGLIGSELARINCVNRESLLKMIILSYVAQSREEIVSNKLSIVVHPKDSEYLNMLEIESFLGSL